MSKFTKAAIMNSFMKLLSAKSFDSITVKDIAEECAINRNTFYYNFEDIYALVDEIFQTEINKIIEEYKPYHSWKEGLFCAMSFALENKKAIYHLHNSVKSNQLEKFFHRVVYNVMEDFVARKAQGKDIEESDIKFIAEFYTCALVGLLNKWLDDGMKGDFSTVVEKISIILDANIEYAVSDMVKNK